MILDLTHILALITGVILIILVLLLYMRSRQGDARAINVTNQMLLFILGAIVVTLNIVFSRQAAAQACTGTLITLKYVGVLAALLLIGIGTVRFFVSRSRDRRLINNPLLLAIVVVTVLFLVEYLNGCI